ncbi:NAD(P)/FAD-dependent oxidoreductase [Bacillus alkalicellulosilyticus]|uniref:NAD(P)/FAD-dependent oxidoreductase n=1 Tax=Alkalihalobacterium alkalicellulosilyticum TaxID=1912214 RepID=UPI0009961457|nr:NAD(P)/FAD-dependent oxidoreductase [Bacillus alkalicellulosilyticus]
MDNTDVVIIGGGPAGISAAIWCQRLKLQHLVLESSEQLGGQLTQIHNEIIDYPGLMTKNGVEMKTHFINQVKKLACRIETSCNVLSINEHSKEIRYQQNGEIRTLFYHFLLLATGSKQRSLSVPGELEMLQRGEVYSAARDNGLFTSKEVAIVGGGDRAFEGAMLLANQGAHVTLIHRSTHFRARQSFQKIVLSHPNIRIVTNAQVTKIFGTNRVEAIEYECNGKQKTVNVDAVLIRIGVEPCSSLLKDKVEVDEQGYIYVNQYGQTSNPSIFAIGDVVNQPSYSSISASIGQGMIAAKHISEQLNSSKGPIYY